MSGQQNTATDLVVENPFIRALIAIALVVTLFFFALKAFNSVIDGVVESKYKWVADRFAQSVNYIHKEWMITKKSSLMTLDYFVDENSTVKMDIQLNDFGWPINIASSGMALNCKNLWMLFAYEKGHSQSMMDLTADLSIEEDQQTGCKYYHLVGNEKKFLFEYQLRTGKVSNTNSQQ